MPASYHYKRAWRNARRAWCASRGILTIYWLAETRDSLRQALTMTWRDVMRFDHD